MTSKEKLFFFTAEPESYMSEFTETKEKRLLKLKEVSRLLLETGNAHSFVVANKDFIPTVVPSDFITLFDEIIKEGHDMTDIKLLSNKVLNIFHTTLTEYQRIIPDPDSFLGLLEQNNKAMEQILQKIRPVYKLFLKDAENQALRQELKALFSKLEGFAKHYVIKENTLFPVLEELWPDYRCVKIMWSFHDDIRYNIKAIINQLGEDYIDIKSFNRCIGDIFFQMLTIKFREEQILFPCIQSTINAEQLDEMIPEGREIGYPYVQPAVTTTQNNKKELRKDLAKLGTGELSVEQIELIFNHLPVDITYVDEHDKVIYFSTPQKRIFPRTKAVLGREVRNCHPPESVHVVEEIIESFKSGKRSKADFWINMKGEKILIQYFAVRDKAGNYRGVIEVSQEISHIRSLDGEKRLLD